MPVQHVCKYCGSLDHPSFNCFSKPRKTMKTSLMKVSRKRMRPIGKLGDKWLKVREQWLKLNPGPHHCHYCGKLISVIELDHKEPRSLRPDLRHNLGNLVPACHTCNTAKSSTPHDKYPHNCPTAPTLPQSPAI